MRRDATTAGKADGLRRELETLNREQEEIVSKDNEVNNGDR
jgi:hypothetical protein